MQESGTTPQEPANNLLRLLAVTAVLVLVGVGAAVVARSTTPNRQPAPEALPPLESEPPITNEPVLIDQDKEESSPSAGEVRTIEVEAGSFYYSPAQIRVKKGETVRIVMNSVDMMHDLVIDELNVRIPVTQSGKSNTVEFTADTVGEFEYYCSVGSHRAQGQVGTIVVEE